MEKILLEIFGYIGTALIILSMTMKSLVKLRIFNISGAVISVIYSIIVKAWPVVLLNAALTVINSYHLISDFVKEKAAKKLADESSDELVTNTERIEGETV